MGLLINDEFRLLTNLFSSKSSFVKQKHQ